jgi:hypothetical protein
MGRPESRSAPRKTRRDGWTAERQLTFLDMLWQTRSITKAARAAGMSRESAYRLRARAELFTALWDRACAISGAGERHNSALTDGSLARLLGNQFRRKSNGFGAVGSPGRSP